MPFACIGFALAVSKEEYDFSIRLFILMLLCMVFARSAAMAFNRYIDVRFDKLNPRTAVREIPSGIIKPSNALFFVVITSVLFIITTAFINRLCLYLSPIALFVILFYSYTKRFTPLCHLVLGLGLSLAPIGAYLAVTGIFDWLPLMFSLLVFTWVSGFDILYALQDEDFDKTHALNSIPVLLGRKGAMLSSRLLHFCSAIILISIGFFFLTSFLYALGAFVFIGLLIYQHSLIKVNDISKIDLAFATTNGVASLVFGVIVILSLII